MSGQSMQLHLPLTSSAADSHARTSAWPESGGLDAPRSRAVARVRAHHREPEPKIVVIENVLGLRTSGLPRVLADLADPVRCGMGGSRSIGHRSAASTTPDVHCCYPLQRVNVPARTGWLERACRKAAAEHRYDPSRSIAASQRYAATGTGAAHPGAGDGLGTLAGSSVTLREWMMGFPRWTWARARKALGNAVVPACTEVISRAIMEAIG